MFNCKKSISVTGKILVTNKQVDETNYNVITIREVRFGNLVIKILTYA